MTKPWILLVCILFTSIQTSQANQTVRRFVLATGANFGGTTRTPLRYAVSDAQNFVQVLESMGGVQADDKFLLQEPTLAEFQEALQHLQERVATASQSANRIEVVVYYSGHADENGLLLGRDRFTYQTLRQAMQTLNADVQIAVLDACASGAITRFKGGQRQQAFLVDESSDMKGHAFLTSSSETEVAQESDVIGASFFTHYLVSGLRGAADISGDGKVTLNEAYQFAFQNTLDRTVDTQGGAQHPSYDIKMTGTGDVVMTDLRQTSAGLILGETLSGRFYIRDNDRRLVAELNKPAGRSIEIGLPPGTYFVHLEQQQSFTTSALEITDEQRHSLTHQDFHQATPLQTTSRGKKAEGLKVEFNEPQFNMGGDNYKVSLGLFYNYQRQAFRGYQLSLFANLAKQQSGHQISGFMNSGEKKVDGVQISSLANLAMGPSRLGQYAGLANFAQDTIHAVQLAGLVNSAKIATGYQFAGLANLNKKETVKFQVSGLGNISGGSVAIGQFSGLANIAKDTSSIQIAGGANISQNIKIGQAGVFNLAKKITGFQMGVTNIANHINGLQVGVLNLSNKNSGEAIGLLSYANNGLLNVNVWQDEVGLSHFTLQSGSQHLYTAYSVAVKAFDQHPVFAFGVGFGGQIESSRTYFDLSGHQYLVYEDIDTNNVFNHLSRLRGSFGIKFTNNISGFAGVSANLLWNGTHKPLLSPWGGQKSISNTGKYATWPGYFIGLRIGRPAS